MDPRELNLGFFNQAAAKLHPDRLALIDLSRTPAREVTHIELDERMNRVATALQKSDLEPGARVLIAMPNRFEFVEAFFGAMRGGFVPIPLNHKLGRKTIEFILADGRVQSAIVDPDCHKEILDIIEESECRLNVTTQNSLSDWINYDEWLSSVEPSSLIPPEIKDGEIAFLPYTSGSTGLPKGVLLPHNGMLWAIKSAQKHWPLNESDRALVAGPLFHKNAMRVSIKPTLRVGGSAVILPKFDPKLFLRALAEYKCTHTGGVPAMYRMILAEKELLSTLQFPALKSLEMGSAVVGADLISAVERAFSVPVIEAYGLTEGGGPIREPIGGAKSPLGSCGLIAPGVELKLVDEMGAENTSNGELWVKSPAVLSGYNNRPDLNEERLVQGFLRTRDIFRRDENGFFFFMGRTDDQFSCGGENINPKEVELLLVQHPSVMDAVVVPIEHSIKGFAPAALITLQDEIAVTEEELKQFTLDHGPAYAHPRKIIIINEMPLNGAGKIDRSEALAIIKNSISGGGTL